MKFFLVAFAISIASFSSTALGNEPLRLAIFEYPPFLSKDVEGYGLEPSIVTAAFEQVGVAVEYTFYPAARAYRVARLGGYDGTLGWVHSAVRERHFFFSDPIAEAPLVFFHLKDSAFDWKDYGDLKGLAIGTVIDYYYGRSFHEALDAGKIEIDVVSDDLLNLRKLLRERIVLTPINLYVGYYLINSYFDSEAAGLLTHHPDPLRTSAHHVLFPRALSESESRLELFNEGLQALKESGAYQRILDDITEN